MVAGLSAGERAATLPSVMWKSADEVARAAIDGLDAGKCRVVPGRINRLVAACSRFAPHEQLLPLLARRAQAKRPI
jgi:short-subunit dehydrogenase